MGGWKNGEEQRIFHGSKYGSVCFNDDGWVIIETAIEQDETFEVEIEQEITEETVIPDLIELFEHTRGIDAIAHSNASIHQIIRGADEDAMSAVSLYTLNDDMTMTLLWRNGGMVE